MSNKIIEQKDYVRWWLYENEIHNEQYGDVDIFVDEDEFRRIEYNNNTNIVQCFNVELSERLFFYFYVPNTYDELKSILDILLK